MYEGTFSERGLFIFINPSSDTAKVGPATLATYARFIIRWAPLNGYVRSYLESYYML